MKNERWEVCHKKFISFVSRTRDPRGTRAEFLLGSKLVEMTAGEASLRYGLHLVAQVHPSSLQVFRQMLQ